MVQSEVVLVGLPFDENSSFLLGAALAPPLIREAIYSDASNLWTENGLDLGVPSRLSVAGDFESFENIENSLLAVLHRSLRPIFLGGDHSVTYPVLKAIRRSFSRLSILHFDAHPDLYHEFQGNRYSHACPFARIMEEGLADRLVQVGIRAMNGHQRQQASKFRVEVVEMKDWREDLRLVFDSPVYVSVDMDALDPAFAPGVSHPEPGGLSTRQVIRLIQSISSPVIGADIVEFNPKRDSSGITAVACAKIIKELAGKMLEGEGQITESPGHTEST